MTLRRVGVVTVFFLLAYPVAAQRSRAVRPRNAPAQCSEVRGVPDVYRSADGGRTFTTNAERSRPSLTWGMVFLEDRPNTVVAAIGSDIYDSLDGGCNWTLRYTSNPPTHHPVRVAGATAGRAYIWSDEVELRYDNGVVAPMSHVERWGGFGVDHSNREHVRGFAVVTGTMYESFDGGLSWSSKGVSPGSGITGAFFDPADFDHILITRSSLGLTMTTDGGASWKPVGALTRSVCDGAFVAGSPNVVWINLAIKGTSDTVYRSVDGGRSFQPVGRMPGLEDNVCTPITINPHDVNRAVVAFRQIYEFDAASSTVTPTSCCAPLVTFVAYSPADRNVVLVYGF